MSYRTEWIEPQFVIELQDEDGHMVGSAHWFYGAWLGLYRPLDCTNMSPLLRDPDGQVIDTTTHEQMIELLKAKHRQMLQSKAEHPTANGNG